jgi:uncharacterized protein (TIGR03382 family)
MKRYVLGVVACCAFAGPAMGAVTWSYFGLGDAGFNVLTNNGALERAVTEGRIGDNLASGTWEQAIWRQGGVTMQTNANFVWSNGATVPFQIQWNGVDTLSYTIGAQVLTWNAVPGSFTDIFVRTRSGAGSTMELFGMDIDGLPFGPLTSSGSGDVQYIRISNDFVDFGAFTITGLSRLTWDPGNRPSNSALAYQFKFTNTTDIPAPGAAVVLALGAGLAARRRR